MQSGLSEDALVYLAHFIFCIDTAFVEWRQAKTVAALGCVTKKGEIGQSQTQVSSLLLVHEILFLVEYCYPG